jgi:hypothetical protein
MVAAKVLARGQRRTSLLLQQISSKKFGRRIRVRLLDIFLLPSCIERYAAEEKLTMRSWLFLTRSAGWTVDARR